MKYLSIALQQQQQQQQDQYQQDQYLQHYQYHRLHPPPCLSISQGIQCLLSICTANSFASQIPSQTASKTASQIPSQNPSQTISVSKKHVAKGAWVNINAQSNLHLPVKCPSQIRSKSSDRAEEFWCHVLTRIYGIYLQGISEYQHQHQQQHFQHIHSPVKNPSQISPASQMFSMELTRFLIAIQSYVSGSLNPCSCLHTFNYSFLLKLFMNPF